MDGALHQKDLVSKRFRREANKKSQKPLLIAESKTETNNRSKAAELLCQ